MNTNQANIERLETELALQANRGEFPACIWDVMEPSLVDNIKAEWEYEGDINEIKTGDDIREVLGNQIDLDHELSNPTPRHLINGDYNYTLNLLMTLDYALSL